MHREIEVDRFMAKTDLGKQYLIMVYQEYLPAGTYTNPRGETEGKRRLVTSNGLNVIYNANGMYYKVLETDELVRRVEATY